MNKVERKFLGIFIFFCIIIFYTLFCWISGDKFYLTKLLSWSIILLVYAYLRLQKQVLIFEPLNLFSLIYLTIPLTNFYYIYSDFEKAVFVDRQTLHADYIYLFNLSAFYYFIGLAAILAGYSVIKRPAFKPIQFESNRTIHPVVLNAVIAGMLMIGVLNFAYNILTMAGGNLLVYLSNIAVRKAEFEETGGTTLGYQFYYMASYLLVYAYLRRNKKPDLFLVVLLGIGVVMRGSTGRIYGTLGYMMTFVAIFYMNKFINTGRTGNRKYLLYLAPLPLLGVGFYFLRIVSSLIAGGSDAGDFSDMAGTFGDMLGFYAVDKGNTPNVAVFMRILDSWQQDYGYLYGKSLLSGIITSFPTGLRPPMEEWDTSLLVWDLWYSNVAGGALPTTCVGEMYMNFGPAGSVVGMFVVGLLIKIWYCIVIKSRSYWQYLIFIIVSVMFIALYPKVDFTNFNLLDIVFVILPFTIVWGLSLIFNVKSVLYKRPNTP